VANARVHATIKAMPPVRLAEERAVMLAASALGAPPPMRHRVVLPVESLQHPEQSELKDCRHAAGKGNTPEHEPVAKRIYLGHKERSMMFRMALPQQQHGVFDRMTKCSARWQRHGGTAHENDQIAVNEIGFAPEFFAKSPFILRAHRPRFFEQRCRLYWQLSKKSCAMCCTLNATEIGQL
jgi:hypothetical protein